MKRLIPVQWAAVSSEPPRQSLLVVCPNDQVNTRTGGFSGQQRECDAGAGWDNGVYTEVWKDRGQRSWGGAWQKRIPLYKENTAFDTVGGEESHSSRMEEFHDVVWCSWQRRHYENWFILLETRTIDTRVQKILWKLETNHVRLIYFLHRSHCLLVNLFSWWCNWRDFAKMYILTKWIY